LGFGFDLYLDLAGDGRDCATVEGDDDAGRDLEPYLVLVDLPNDPVEAARGDDLVVDVDRVLHRSV